MKKTFTILHTNDIHSNLVSVGPASEYTPATLNDDHTIGGRFDVRARCGAWRRLRGGRSGWSPPSRSAGRGLCGREYRE